MRLTKKIETVKKIEELTKIYTLEGMTLSGAKAKALNVVTKLLLQGKI